MKHLDIELLDKTEKYTALMKETGLEEAIAALAEETEYENPEEDFYRLFNFKGDILLSTDMSLWGNVSQQGILSKMGNDGLTNAIQTITVPQLDDNRP